MNASNKEVAFVGTGIPPGCMGKVCGSVVWALPMQRDSKGQPTHSGSRLYPGSDIQLQSVSKTASKAETIEEEDNKKTAGEQRLCESESVKKGRRVRGRESVRWTGMLKVCVGVTILVCRIGPLLHAHSSVLYASQRG